MAGINFNKTLHTNGFGQWGAVAGPVLITGLDIAYVNNSENFGELRIYFDVSCVNKYALIYTDPLFLHELKVYLSSFGFDCTDVNYSDFEMQGNNFVSLDITANFISSFQKLHPETYAKMLYDIWEYNY